MTVFIILLIIIIIAAGYYGYKKGSYLGKSGKLVMRDSRFYEDAELLFTKTPYNDLRDALMDADYTGSGVAGPRPYGEQPILVFQSKNGFVAAVAYLGEENSEHKYEFSFLKWTSGKHGASFIQMNVLMTVIEKVFLALDPDTEAQIEPRNIKTTTKLF